MYLQALTRRTIADKTSQIDETTVSGPFLAPSKVIAFAISLVQIFGTKKK